ncbi:MAG: DnaJ domain-containing protein [Anaerolineales bacterium]|jgi:Ca-activated chloride channel family protein
MAGVKDYYALLGISRKATRKQIRRAYREAAIRLHPDKREQSGKTSLFIEVTEAYEVLSDPKRRAEYDSILATSGVDTFPKAFIKINLRQSREHLVRIDEPQVHYLLLDIHPAEDLPEMRPPINLCILIDRSTSMAGPRLDQVRGGTLSILKQLSTNDQVTVATFSDRSEVVITPSQALDISLARARLSMLQASGGTEIGQGLKCGLDELRSHFIEGGVNQLVLFTDGRTYGDEEFCLSMAQQAAKDGFTINAVGIGADWSDRFLDALAAQTGGNVVYMDSPRAVTDLLAGIFHALGRMIVRSVILDGELHPQVGLRSAFRLLPEPMPVADSLPLLLGNLPRDGIISVLLEFVIQPLGNIEQLLLANLFVEGELLGSESQGHRLPVEIRSPVSDAPLHSPPDAEILAALSAVTLYRMQERARHEAELGQYPQAARRLKHLATHLIAQGERKLAKAALGEAKRLARAEHLSTEGQKTLKYGTRALLIRHQEEPK